MFLIFLNLLIDLIPRKNGIITAWICAKNKIEKNKLIFKPHQRPNLNWKSFIYLKRDKYHCKTTSIIIVRTKGKAGYRVWKSAGGHGDHDISLPLGLIEEFKFSFFLVDTFFVAKPLLITKTN